MKFEKLLDLVGADVVFTSAFLMSGNQSAKRVRLQLSRWVKTGRIMRLRRGLYALGRTWRKMQPHPFLIANALHHGSYVSLQSALAYHSVIPEYVPVVTSVGPGRPETVRNALGIFQCKHTTSEGMFGYTRAEVASGQFAFVATPEKAFLDGVHFTKDADSIDYIRELRIHGYEVINLERLRELAERWRKPKLLRATRHLTSLLSQKTGEWL